MLAVSCFRWIIRTRKAEDEELRRRGSNIKDPPNPIEEAEDGSSHGGNLGYLKEILHMVEN